MVDGRKITVIETPGPFDTYCDKEIKSEIIKSLIECAPAVHAFAILLNVGRNTRHENEVVQQFLNTLTEEHVLKHTVSVILFIHCEQLKGQTIERFKAKSKLLELDNYCRGRCHDPLVGLQEKQRSGETFAGHHCQDVEREMLQQ